MQSRLHRLHATRLVFGAFAALALLAATSAVAAAEPITSDQFAPGWQEHARPLFYGGMTRDAGRDKLLVPGILPTGEYVLIKRQGDKAELLGQRVIVHSGNEKQYVFVDAGTGSNVEALPISDVPALKPTPGAPMLR